jgi:hypothetical protein
MALLSHASALQPSKRTPCQTSDLRLAKQVAIDIDSGSSSRSSGESPDAKQHKLGITNGKNAGKLTFQRNVLTLAARHAQ